MAISVLLKKEFSCFFASATGYIVIGVFLLMTGLFLWVFPGEYNVLDSGYANIDGLFVMAPWLYLFLVPAVTMRLFSDEKRTGTIELLMTHPVSKLEIVLSKYFAGVLLALFSLVPTLVYFFSVWAMADPIGNIDTGGIWGSFIGLFFLATIYVAIGLFTSSLTDNQIVAFICAALLSFAFFYGFDLISSLLISGEEQTLVSSLGISSHYDGMSRGVIDSRDLLYFILVDAAFVYLTKLILSKKK